MKLSPRRQRELDEAVESENKARALDGLPPIKRSRAEVEEMVVDAAAVDIPSNDDDDLLLVENDDEILWSRSQAKLFGVV